ncbi:MAG: hypothetical protein GY788_03490 [bacterium]|nr:hypothetical protein [bacterium]
MPGRGLLRFLGPVLVLVLVSLFGGFGGGGSAQASTSLVGGPTYLYDGGGHLDVAMSALTIDSAAPRVAGVVCGSGHVYDSPANRYATNTAARGGAGPVRVGQEGLDYLGVTQNTTRIPRPTGTGYRVPDILDEAGGVIGEVKNVQSLSYTQQLRDYVWYAEQNSLQFDLYVRGSTHLSGPLQTAVDDGLINLFRALP